MDTLVMALVTITVFILFVAMIVVTSSLSKLGDLDKEEDESSS